MNGHLEQMSINSGITLSNLTFRNFRLWREEIFIEFLLSGKDLTNVLNSIGEALVGIGYIDEEVGRTILPILLYRHTYVDGKSSKKWSLHRRRHGIDHGSNPGWTDNEEEFPLYSNLQKISRRMTMYNLSRSTNLSSAVCIINSRSILLKNLFNEKYSKNNSRSFIWSLIILYKFANYKRQ